MSSVKLVFLITESWYFLSHRLAIAQASKDIGYDVVLVTNLAERDRPRLADFRVGPLRLRRSSLNPLRELMSLWRVIAVVWRERPRILHMVGLKPVLYGSVAAAVLGVDAVCALAGLGYLFTSGTWRVRLVRFLVVLWLRLALKRRRSWVVLQNSDDASALLAHKIVPRSRIVLIRGSGVDIKHFQPLPEPPGTPVFALVARMLSDKGIRETVWAARILRWRGVAFRLLLVGEPDDQNLSSLTAHQLRAWSKESIVEWTGFQPDVRKVWAEAHVCLLPSYREGLPKSLLEAAACGRPIVTTAVPGCQDVVTNGVEGLVVPPRNCHALADAMERLALAPELRRRMGRAARQRVETDFRLEITVAQTLSLYRSILEGG
ncbi:MAG: glycosyltransferase [Azospirillum sp.]|nr:glycosyltransferase [Azospirillum sp.]